MRSAKKRHNSHLSKRICRTCEAHRSRAMRFTSFSTSYAGCVQHLQGGSGRQNIDKLFNLFLSTMKQLCFYFGSLILILSGCDASFGRRLDISATDGISLSSNAATASAVVNAIKEYADSNGLACSKGNALPIECYRQPIRIWALATETGAVVCYGGMGIPLESRKFESRMDMLQNTLVEKLGRGVVAPQRNPCPNPPSFNP